MNLAPLATPMSKQAAEVHTLSTRLGEIRPGKALDPLDAELLNQRRLAAQPKTHDFELQPLSN